jgi:hypothetical protein
LTRLDVELDCYFDIVDMLCVTESKATPRQLFIDTAEHVIDIIEINRCHVAYSLLFTMFLLCVHLNNNASTE